MKLRNRADYRTLVWAFVFFPAAAFAPQTLRARDRM